MSELEFRSVEEVIKELQFLIRRVGVKNFREDNHKYKQDKEMWVGVLTLLGMRKIQNAENEKWYITKSGENAPDIFAINENHEWEAHIEVVQLEKHGKKDFFDPKKSNEENIVNFLKEKKFEKTKDYGEKTLLFLYLDVDIDGVKFGELFKKTKPKKLAEVWSLAFVGSNEYAIVCLFPEKKSTKIKLADYL